jgi:hypothetical protein
VNMSPSTMIDRPFLKSLVSIYSLAIPPGLVYRLSVEL